MKNCRLSVWKSLKSVVWKRDEGSEVGNLFFEGIVGKGGNIIRSLNYFLIARKFR